MQFKIFYMSPGTNERNQQVNNKINSKISQNVKFIKKQEYMLFLSKQTRGYTSYISKYSSVVES